MIFYLPYPISNNRNARFGNGKVYQSKEAKAYKQQVAWIAKAVIGCNPPLECDVNVKMWLHPKMNKDGTASKTIQDLDNVCKVAFDALNGIAWVDDKQIKKLYIEVSTPVKGGGLTVQVF